MVIYKVRDKNTGLFVQRGSWRVYLSKNGTIWKRKSDLKQSISYTLNQKLKNKFPNVDLEVVEYEIIEKNKTNLSDW